ncbi:uncharacterized protein LOC107867251 isoform X2 [Capsicum annuum]|uniref:uncharacterized protein LOC107867251 isoform X2 n=1 Tax=Capsicum annuum TaxID=4072 RepID=UPI001FB180FD|nr:uncharacterized protein LOC107867251 isoform X2 [Capsicum annuum]
MYEQVAREEQYIYIQNRCSNLSFSFSNCCCMYDSENKKSVHMACLIASYYLSVLCFRGKDSSQVFLQSPINEITTVSERVEGVDPILEKLKKNLSKLLPPIRKSPPAESSLTHILTSSTSNKGRLNLGC